MWLHNENERNRENATTRRRNHKDMKSEDSQDANTKGKTIRMRIRKRRLSGCEYEREDYRDANTKEKAIRMRIRKRRLSGCEYEREECNHHMTTNAQDERKWRKTKFFRRDSKHISIRMWNNSEKRKSKQKTLQSLMSLQSKWKVKTSFIYFSEQTTWWSRSLLVLIVLTVW